MKIEFDMKDTRSKDFIRGLICATCRTFFESKHTSTSIKAQLEKYCLSELIAVDEELEMEALLTLVELAETSQAKSALDPKKQLLPMFEHFSNFKIIAKQTFDRWRETKDRAFIKKFNGLLVFYERLYF